MAFRYGILQKGVQELESHIQEFNQNQQHSTTGDDPERMETVQVFSRKFSFLKKLLLAEMEPHCTHDDSDAHCLHLIGERLQEIEDKSVELKIPLVELESPTVHEALRLTVQCPCTISCLEKGDDVDDDHGVVLHKKDDGTVEEPRTEDVGEDHGVVFDKEEDGMVDEPPSEDGNLSPLIGKQQELKIDKEKTKKKGRSFGYTMLMAFLFVMIVVIGWIEGDEDDEFLVPT